jgi:multidrug transporter EmrE-like cation transporter
MMEVGLIPRTAAIVGLGGIGLLASGALTSGLPRVLLVVTGLMALVVGKLSLGGTVPTKLAECWRNSLLFRVNTTAAVILLTVFVWATRNSDGKTARGLLPGIGILAVILFSEFLFRPRHGKSAPDAELQASR